jgi:putative transposase
MTRETVSPRRRYPSDLSRAQWDRVNPFVAAAASRSTQRRTDLREVMNAVNYRWHTGCPWRMLPHDFPPWGTVYRYFHAWDRAGLLPQLRDSLLKRSRLRLTKPPPVSN